MANELEIATTFIPHLKNQFARGAVVLFTGAGFSLDAISTSGERLPSAAVLCRALWEIRYPGMEFDPSTQLQDIYEAAIQTSRAATERLLKRLFTVDPRRCPPFYNEILSMPWTRIYTLNIDDLAEKVLESATPQRPVVSISATTGNISALGVRGLNIIHLNGSMEDVPQDVTFSRSQYARRHGMDAFYTQLRHDLISRPVVFIGSSLEEGPLWQHLEMRGPPPRRDEREMRPRSYLVTPSLNRSKEALLSNFNIVWLQMTAQQFAVEMLAPMEEEKRAGSLVLRRSRDEEDVGTPRLLRLENLPPPATEATEYLLGAEPEWCDVQLRRVAHRDCFDELHDKLIAIRARPAVKQFLVVTGTAGTGKTSAMMMTAVRLQAAGISTAWVDAADRFEAGALRRTLQEEAGPEAIFVGNADLLERRLSRLVRDALESRPTMLVVCECRSSKIERIISREELAGIEPIEYTIPYLGDGDIDAILDVLDRENRLGALRGQTRERRRSIFRAEAGRQMLVAMYKATHGREFKEKVVEELCELEATQRFLYGLVCVAHAHRFHLAKDELALAFGDDIERWPRALDALTRRKLLLGSAEEGFKGRHREIAQFVYDELTRQGAIADVVRGIVKIVGTKATVNTSRTSRTGKMLGTFINHALMKRTVGAAVGRQIYGEFEELLAWDYHYWLHRGALELESGNLGLAENFLLQAKGIEPNDVFVDNELAYLALRKAVDEPYSVESEQLVRDAIVSFDAIAARRPDQRAHVYHIMGTQGLAWSRKARMSDAERGAFLGRLHRNVQSVLEDDTDGMLGKLDQDLRREILGLAVDRGS